MNLTVPIILTAAGIIALFPALWGEDIKIPGKMKVPALSGRARIVSGIVGVAFIGIAIWLFLQPPLSTGERGTSSAIVPLSSPVTSKYSFEDGPMGWIPQDYVNSKATVQVQYTNEIPPKEGLYSLQMLMELIGGDANKSQGEAWVNMSDNRPDGETIPVDLTDRTVTAWVYAPPGSRGDRSKPNGFQLFVTDEEWLNEYGPWNNVVEGQWVKFSLTVSNSEPTDGYMDNGFDPSRIIAVGVKMGSGGGSTQKYEGPVYIDAIDW